jgi:hypothetical protein
MTYPNTLSERKTIVGKEAFQVFKSLESNDFNELIERLIAFEKYLSKLCLQISSSGLKDVFIYHWIFKHEVHKQKEIENFYKSNIFAARASIGRIISKIKNEEINQVTLRMLSDFICDLKNIIFYFDKTQDYSWLLVNTNSHGSNYYNDLSTNVFWSGMPGKNSEEMMTLSSSTPFMIRQSIEYKIKRLLGIDYLIIDEKRDTRTTMRCFKAIENNKKFYKNSSFDFKIIRQIHAWTNYYIHGGYRPEPWRTETAINYLKNLFYAGMTSENKSLSLYAGVEVFEIDLSKIIENTEKSIRQDISGNVQIKWLTNPELCLLKK